MLVAVLGVLPGHVEVAHLIGADLIFRGGNLDRQGDLLVQLDLGALGEGGGGEGHGGRIVPRRHRDLAGIDAGCVLTGHAHPLGHFAEGQRDAARASGGLQDAVLRGVPFPVRQLVGPQVDGLGPLHLEIEDVVGLHAQGQQVGQGLLLLAELGGGDSHGPALIFVFIPVCAAPRQGQGQRRRQQQGDTSFCPHKEHLQLKKSVELKDIIAQFRPPVQRRRGRENFSLSPTAVYGIIMFQ